MKFTVVEELPEKRTECKKLHNIFEEFMRMNVKAAKYEFAENEYKSVSSAHGNLYKGARRWGYPIYVVRRSDEIYFVRKDM